MYLALIADVIDSKMVQERFNLQKQLEKTLRKMNELFGDYLASCFTLTLGDEFQALLKMDAPVFQIIERKTKRNRIFYGCNRYPECEFTSWDKPIGRDCPKCGQYLVEKKVRGGGKQVVCSNGDYEEEKVK